MKALVLAIAILAGFSTVTAYAGPNEPCTGDHCPKKPKGDKGR